MDGLVGDELEAARAVQRRHARWRPPHRCAAGRQLAHSYPRVPDRGLLAAQNIAAVKILATGWVNDMFAGTHDGIYGAPQQTIQIDTSAGTAAAVVLPFTSTKTVQATPFDGLSSVIVDMLIQNLVYEPLAGRPGALTR
jgi:hypothetical protein